MSLSRFHTAQASPTAGYDTALAEIRRGGKTMLVLFSCHFYSIGRSRAAMPAASRLLHLAGGPR